MTAASGAAAWQFVPVVGGAAAPKARDVEIGSHQNSWNNAGTNSTISRQRLHASKPHRPKAQNPMTRVVRLEVYILQGGNMALETDTYKLVVSYFRCTRLELAFAQAQPGDVVALGLQLQPCVALTGVHAP